VRQGEEGLEASPYFVLPSGHRLSRNLLPAEHTLVLSLPAAERAAWAADDLLFISNYGEGDERQITFAHFSQTEASYDLPTLKVLGWDNLDTPLHLDAVVKELTNHLAWPEDEDNVEAWRRNWRSAFTLRHREVITTSRDLSIRLAELARAISNRFQMTTSSL
jgi:hypothetical protein